MDYPEVTTDMVAQWRADNGLLHKPVLEFTVNYAASLVYEYLNYCTWEPTDPKHVEAVRAATAFTVTVWIEADINPLSEGLAANPNIVASASLLGGSFTNTNPAQIARRRAAHTSTLHGDAIRILTLAGIRPAAPTVVG